MTFHQLQRLYRDEGGLAMVVALLVSFVVLMLSVVVVAQSIHSLDSSGFDRQRLTSVNAAEAGTNAWWEDLQTKTLVELKADCGTKTSTLSSAPNDSSYSATASFYGTDGSTPMTCSSLSDANAPGYVRIVSTGTSEGEASRQIETFAKLTAFRSGFGAAIMAVNGTTFNNNFTVVGQSGNDGDVYILNGSLTITNTPTIYGNVYVPLGAATFSNNSEVKGDLWARDTVTINNPSKVSGNAKSTTGNIAGSGTVVGNATATGTTPITTVNGTRYPGTNPGPVPTQTFPQIGSSTTDWVAAGYTVQTFSGASACTNAYNYIHNTGAGTWATSGITNLVVRIAQTCNMTNSNNDVIAVRGNLAIITDGGFNLQQRSNWNGTSSPIKSVYFISAYSAAACTGTKNISVSNNTNFDAFTNVFFYTPCTADMANTNAFTGQVLAGTVVIQNQFKVNYTPVLVPNQGTITGFQQDISYVREI